MIRRRTFPTSRSPRPDRRQRSARGNVPSHVNRPRIPREDFERIFIGAVVADGELKTVESVVRPVVPPQRLCESKAA